MIIMLVFKQNTDDFMIQLKKKKETKINKKMKRKKKKGKRMTD